jgi:iron complex outermembrane recepter protein
LSFRNRDVLTYFSPSPSTHTAVDTLGVTTRYLLERSIADRQLNIVTGVDHYEDKNPIYQPNNTDIIMTRDITGIYGQAEYEIVRDIFLKGGARHEMAQYVFDDRKKSVYATKDPSQNVYETQLRWQYASSSNIFAGYSESFRFPATDEYYSSFSGVLSTALKPQSGHTYTIGIKHSFEDKLIFSGTTYLTRNKDEIYYDPVGYANSNIERTKRSGVEATVEADILKFLDLKVLDRLRWTNSYTFENPRISVGINKGKIIPGVVRNQFTSGIDIGFAKKYTLNVMGRYRGASFMTSDWDNNFEKLKPCVVVDTRLSYEHKKMTLFIEGNNILSYKYFSQAADYGVGYYYPAPQRSVLVGVKYRF